MIRSIVTTFRGVDTRHIWTFAALAALVTLALGSAAAP